MLCAVFVSHPIAFWSVRRAVVLLRMGIRFDIHKELSKGYQI